MSVRKKERYSLRSACRDHGSCSCRNALDSTSPSRTPKRRSLQSPKTLVESSETSDYSDYGSITSDICMNYSNSSVYHTEISSESDENSIPVVFENCHSFSSKSIKRVTFSDIVGYSSSKAGYEINYGTPKQSINSEVLPRTILVLNNHSADLSNGINGIHSSPSQIISSGDTFESRPPISVITSEAAEMSTKSQRTWGEKACATLKYIGFPVYCLLLWCFVIEKWLLRIFSRDAGGGGESSSSLTSLWNEGRHAMSSMNQNHINYMQEERHSYQNGRGQRVVNHRYDGLYYNNVNNQLQDTPKTSAAAYAGGRSTSAMYGNGNHYSKGHAMFRGRSSSRDVDAGAFNRHEVQSSSTGIVVNEGWISRLWKSLVDRNYWWGSSNKSNLQTYYGNAVTRNSSVYTAHVKTGNGIISDDDDDEDFIRSSVDVSKRRNRSVRTKIGKQTSMEPNFLKDVDVDSYDENEDEDLVLPAIVDGIGFWGFLWRLIVLLGLMGGIIVAVYWFWPVAASIALRSWEYTYSLLSNAAEGAINICSVVISSIPFSFLSRKADVTSQVPVDSTVNIADSNGISADDYANILLQIQNIQSTLKSHEEKLESHEDNFKKLSEQILQLHNTMKAVTSSGKSTEQIIVEVMKAKLGESSDGKAVTLENLLDSIKQDRELHRGKLEQNLVDLSMQITDAQNAYSAKTNNFDIDLKFVQQSQKELRFQLNDLQTRNVEVDVDKIKEAILPGLVSEINSQVKISCQTRDCPELAVADHPINPGLTTAEVEKLIYVALSKYDADKTGIPDLALEPAGGSILSTRCTRSSKLRNSVVSLWGFKIWSPPNNPRTIIQPGVVPGECWAFEGSVGDVVIKLISSSIITGFTMEHISKSISPYKNIDSAPREFQVLGLHDENDLDTAHDFGNFTYEDNDEPLQFFTVQNLTETAYPIVELKIKSNHGSLLHTCLYRFRVHGSLVIGGAPFTATVMAAEDGV